MITRTRLPYTQTRTLPTPCPFLTVTFLSCEEEELQNIAIVVFYNAVVTGGSRGRKTKYGPFMDATDVSVLENPEDFADFS